MAILWSTTALVSWVVQTPLCQSSGSIVDSILGISAKRRRKVQQVDALIKNSSCILVSVRISEIVVLMFDHVHR